MSDESRALEGTPYQTIGLLGQGGMGVVYEAEHRALKKRVVVKLLHERFASQPHLVDRMRLEAQALAGLSSPHLVQVHDLGTNSAGQPYFVMEMLAGSTLAQRLADKGAMPIAEAADVARQILRGLAVAHAAGIVHRDVKPENIFLCDRPGESPLVKILDFGIAKVLEPNASSGPAPLAFPTEEGAVLGTPRYLSPEQAKGLKVDLRADLYSVGLVMFAMLTGTRPFEGVRDYLDLVRAHAEEPPIPPSQVATQPIPPELDQAAFKAMQKDPNARYASALAFEQAIARAMRAVRDQSERTETPPGHIPAAPIAAAARASHAPKPTLRMESPLEEARGAEAARPETPKETERFPPMRVGVEPTSARGGVATATPPRGAFEEEAPARTPARLHPAVAVFALVVAVGVAVVLTMLVHSMWSGA